MSLAPHQPSSRYRRMVIMGKWGEKDERSLAFSRRLLARDGRGFRLLTIITFSLQGHLSLSTENSRALSVRGSLGFLQIYKRTKVNTSSPFNKSATRQRIHLWDGLDRPWEYHLTIYCVFQNIVEISLSHLLLDNNTRYLSNKHTHWRSLSVTKSAYWWSYLKVRVAQKVKIYPPISDLTLERINLCLNAHL